MICWLLQRSTSEERIWGRLGFHGRDYKESRRWPRGADDHLTQIVRNRIKRQFSMNLIVVKLWGNMGILSSEVQMERTESLHFWR